MGRRPRVELVQHGNLNDFTHLIYAMESILYPDSIFLFVYGVTVVFASQVFSLNCAIGGSSSMFMGLGCFQL